MDWARTSLPERERMLARLLRNYFPTTRRYLVRLSRYVNKAERERDRETTTRKKSMRVIEVCVEGGETSREILISFMHRSPYRSKTCNQVSLFSSVFFFRLKIIETGRRFNCSIIQWIVWHQGVLVKCKLILPLFSCGLSATQTLLCSWYIVVSFCLHYWFQRWWRESGNRWDWSSVFVLCPRSILFFVDSLADSAFRVHPTFVFPVLSSD